MQTCRKKAQAWRRHATGGSPPLDMLRKRFMLGSDEYAKFTNYQFNRRFTCPPPLMKLKIAPACLLAAACITVLAAPAPWHQWRSKVDGKQFCAQTSLGSGWEKVSGPYKDSHCEKFAVAK
jgi:hypothetical protein